MAIRLTGMNSGLDTETIISQLVSAKSVKVTSLKKAKIKLSWKQDAWKELNTKIYSLYTGTVNKLRWDSAYSKKKSTLSQTGILSVVAGDNAACGVQTASVEKLAKAGYLTGSRISTAAGDKVSADTKLTDLGLAAGEGFTIQNGKTGDPVRIEITEDMTMGNLVSKLNEVGVNANFDEGQQRLFINSKETGIDKDFSFGSGDDAVLEKLGLTGGDSVRILGDDAVMYLNGAKFTSSTNTFQINGSTYTAEGVSEKNADGSLKELSITTMEDYDDVYDTIKNFFKEYNELINEMTKLYNADAAKGYDPLTSEEKQDLSESEVEEWEKKVKDSLLRRDSSLNNILSAMKNSMMGSITVDGEEMYLSSFGIQTLGFLKAEENQQYAYHIDGDVSDSAVAGNADKLKSMIASDPNKVKSFFTQMANNLYNAMFSTMGSIPDVSSMYKVYNDKQMKTELSDYESKIAKAEEALAAYEDKWYDKFAQMETALAKLSSKQNAIAGLFSS